MDAKELTLVEHLDELRKRILISLITLAITASCVFPFSRQILKILKLPAGDSIKQLAFFSPQEALLVYLKIAIFAGIALSMPVILHQIWLFVSPALRVNTRRYTLTFIGFTLLAFVCGILFSYFILLPISLRFLLNFAKDDLVPVISVARYISFVLGVCLACGLVFEMPVVSFILSKIGLINSKLLRKKRKYALIAILIVAALVTPTPDVFNMLLLALPMLVLYEMSIWIARIAGPKVNKIQ